MSNKSKRNRNRNNDGTGKIGTSPDKVDDPRLTAFALGELEGAEAAEVARQVERSPELAAVVNDIRATAGTLSDALGAEGQPEFTPQQRQAVLSGSDPSRATSEPPTSVGADARSFDKDRSLTVAALTGGATDRALSASQDSEPSRVLKHAAQGESAAPLRSSAEAKHDVWQFARRISRRWYVPASLAASVLLVVGALAIYAPSLSRSRERRVSVKDMKSVGTSAKLHGGNKPESYLDGPSTIVNGEQGGTGKQVVDLYDAGRVSANESRLKGYEQPKLVQSAPQVDLRRRSPVDGAQARSSSAQRHAVQAPEGMSTEQVAEWVSANDPTLAVSKAFDPNNLVASYYKVGPSDDVTGAKRRRSRRVEGETHPSVEAYDHIVENPFLLVETNALSTFSIDVDTASYANVRRMLTSGMLPPAGAVRIEEMINYFDYDYPVPTDGHPFSVNVEIADCPWNGDHRLARIGLKGYEIEYDERPAANLVFLIDVSGSMNSPNKLPLLVNALSMLVDELTRDDDVSIVVYAGATGMVLSPTRGDSKSTILSSLARLRSGGSTNGGAGIQLAYETALDNFIEGGINRVILATDGDFNVGVTSQSELVSMIEDKARDDIFLSVLGFGMGNLKDSTLEKLADKGNGNYAYIDTEMEAHKVLVEQVSGTLFTIAKDVKLQIEFNPAVVQGYRLIGYENRMLAAQDFNDDTKDAGEIGAGHTVTALYEIVPFGVEMDAPSVDPLKYQTSGEPSEAVASGETMNIKLRYKEPEGDVSTPMEIPIIDGGRTLEESSADFALASSVAAFGMLLRNSQYVADYTFDDVWELANSSIEDVDEADEYRTEFLTLVQRAMELSGR